MRKIYVRLAGVLLSGVLLVETVPVSAVTPGAGVTGYTSNIMTSASMPTAGVTATLSDSMLNGESQAMAASIIGEDALVRPDYEAVAIANVTDFVYVRAEANSESEYVGKLYNKNAATILEKLDGWYKIKSGKIEGYVSSEFVLVGDEEAYNKATKRRAKVETNSLRVRAEADANADIVKIVGVGDDLVVLAEAENGWVKVKTDEGEGYVSADYVEVYTKYSYGETKEAEQTRIAAEEAAKRAEEARIAAEREYAERVAAREKAKKKKQNSTSSSSGIKAPGSKTGRAVASYACQFIGNPYVWGGTSLTKGADCSGFVMAVYKKFGVSLPHSSSALRKVGKKVDPSSMAAGDIVCYRGHVGIYVGGGKMVNASSRKTGIKYTNVHYRTIVAVRRIF